jgi:hypothetical protein
VLIFYLGVLCILTSATDGRPILQLPEPRETPPSKLRSTKRWGSRSGSVYKDPLLAVRVIFAAQQKSSPTLACALEVLVTRASVLILVHNRLCMPFLSRRGVCPVGGSAIIAGPDPGMPRGSS